MSTTLSTLGKYQLHEELGHGGFATVYRAHDSDLGLDVALKVLAANYMRDPAFVERFRTEARVTARLKHPNIARVINIDQADGRLFLAIEYVPGRNLRDRLHDQPLLDWPLITSIVQQVGDALDYAHGQGVLHRDVKPNNILVTDDGLAVLTDFGLAKAAEGSGLTTSGVTLGTFKYIAPEQASGKEVDARSDLYSLAVVAYELCTGRAPFNNDSTPALIHAQVYDAPPPPSQINARVAAPIEQVLLKGLSKEREARYQSGQEFAAALGAAVDQVRGEYLEQLYQEAQSAARRDDFDAAETKLRQVLAIQPDQAPAQALLNTIGLKREVKQRYEQVVETVQAVRKEIAALRQIDPNLEDPAGILGILGAQANRRKSRPRTEPKPKTEGRRFWLRRKPTKSPPPENTPKKTRRWRLWPRRTRQMSPAIKKPVADVNSTSTISNTGSNALVEKSKAQSGRKPLTWRRVFLVSLISGCVLIGIGFLVAAITDYGGLQYLFILPGIASGCVALLSLVPPVWRLIQRFLRWIGRKFKRLVLALVKATAKKQP